MIEIDFGKLILLALIALFVLGPEKLPHAARTAGALTRRVRTGWHNVKSEVERELQMEGVCRQAREAAATAQTAPTQWQEVLRSVQPGSHVSALLPTRTDASITTKSALSSTMQQEAPHGSA